MNIIKKVIDVILNPAVILAFSACMLVVGRWIFGKTYINCLDIIRNHVLCFKMDNGRISKMSIFLYFGIPLLLSIALVRIKGVDEDTINIITIIVSILTSMFFTLLTLILDMRSKIEHNSNYTDTEAMVSKKVLEETYYSIMFEILVSVALLILCFLDIFSSKFSLIESLLMYYMMFILLTNLFMILKRIFKVINNDLNH